MKYTLGVTAVGEGGEEIETTVEKEAESAEEAKDAYLETVNDIVEYWGITVERVEESRHSG